MSWQYAFKTPTSSSTAYAFGRHDYVLAAADCGLSKNHTWLWSWETGAGPIVENNAFENYLTLMKATAVAMDGLSCLEGVYMDTGSLDPAAVAKACGRSPSLQYAALNAGGKWQ